jgi:Flp pilus assembly protein TadD
MLRIAGALSLSAPILVSFLLSSVECRAQSATAESMSSPILAANTSVQLRLKKNLYKTDAKPGWPVEFEVAFDVIVDEQVVIPSGAAVNGSIREVDQTGKAPAELLIDLEPTRTITGEIVRLTGPGTTKDDASLGGKPSLKDVPGMVGWGPEIIPVLPIVVPVIAVMELFPGKKVLLHKDNQVVAHVAENVALDAAKLKAGQAQFRESLRGRKMASCIWAGSPGQGRDLDGAIKDCQQALTLEPDSSYLPLLHLQIARLFLGKDDFVHAIAEYRTAVQLDPKEESFRIGLVNALEDSGDPDAALAEIREAIRIGPDDAYLHYLLGRLLIQRNEPDTAIVELQWALKKAKNHFSQANCALGRALELKGDLQAALREYRLAYRAHLDDQQGRAAYERLQIQLKK